MTERLTHLLTVSPLRAGAAVITLLLPSACGGGNSSSPSTPPPTACTAVEWQTAFATLPDVDGLIGLHVAPGDSNQIYLLRKNGLVQRFARNDPAVLSTVLDLRAQVRDSGESGLLGMAFHPQFASNGQLFVYFTGGDPLTSFLQRYTRSAAGSFAPASALELLRAAQPYSNHNGGQLAFGPDGFLYLALGDGGSGGDPQGHGQNTQSLLGKILRLDVDRQSDGRAYAIPADNPFVSGGGRGEIYAWGLRNPWRFSFDRVSGELWAADVGQNQWEEIDRIVRGGNYGWAIMEGRECYNAGSCSSAGLQAPVHVYSHADGCSVTGGYVYRGGALAHLQGRYVFGDFCSRKAWSLNVLNASDVSALSQIPVAPASFAEDADGTLYALTLSASAGQHVWRLAKAASCGN